MFQCGGDVGSGGII